MLARLSRRPVTSVLRSSRAFPSGRGNNRLISRRQYISDKNSYEEWKEDFLANIRRKGLLLKGNMTSRKFISLPWPPSTTTTRYTFTFSDLAGHTSFLFLALSYLENDFLHLRLYALSGITMSIIFQYYREKPLWIPIRWNSLFFLINSIMICLLLKKQTDAENLPEDQKQLYYKVFQAKGMTPVEFLQLISIAKRLEAKPNDKLVDQHKTNTRLYLVVKGNLTVLKNEQKVGTIKDNQFVGAMSFLNWQSRVHEDLLHRKELEEQGWSTPWEEHIASVFSLTRKKKVHEVIREAHAANKAKQQQEEASAEGVATLAATTSIATGAEAGTSEGLLAAGMIKTTSDVDGNALAGVVTNTATGTTEDESQTLKAEFDSDSLVVNPANASTDPLAADGNVDEGVANTGSILEDGHLASADAVCDDECIVYYWKFKDLRYLMQDYPMLGLVFERCISDDLNQKMTSTWDEELKIRYKQLLTGALMDGEVNEKARMMLSEFRQTYQISEQDHEEMLQQLSWTIDDYEAGHKE